MKWSKTCLITKLVFYWLQFKVILVEYVFLILTNYQQAFVKVYKRTPITNTSSMWSLFPFQS